MICQKPPKNIGDARTVGWVGYSNVLPQSRNMHVRLMSLHTILKDYQLFTDNVSDVDNGSERFCKTKNYIASVEDNHRWKNMAT